MSRPSKRFTPSRWSELAVPAILLLLLLILVGTVIFIALDSLGFLTFA